MHLKKSLNPPNPESNPHKIKRKRIEHPSKLINANPINETSYDIVIKDEIVLRIELECCHG